MSNDESSDDDDNPKGFWTFLRRTRKYSFDEKTEERIDKRQRLVCKRGFGISYEWITQPSEWSSNVGYIWNEEDKYFSGVSKEDFEHVLYYFTDSKGQLVKFKNDSEDADDSDAEGDDTGRRSRPYIDSGGELCIPDHLFRTSSLPTPLAMAGEYDIVYYGGQCPQFLGCNYRTARGSLQLSNTVNEKGVSVVSGTVTMHPCMDDIDVVPFGGNYSIVEKSRVQRSARQIITKNPKDDIKHCAGVIKVEVTEPPDGLCFRSEYEVEKDFVLRGEMRIIREKSGAGITNQEPEGMHDEGYHVANCKFKSTDEAEALNKAHYANTCSWLHKYTILDEQAASEVGKFVCPPPVFFFTEGDIEIDIDWNSVAGGHNRATSCIIARRRTDAPNARPGLLVSKENKYEKEMSMVQAEIEILERKKDMIWLAYECAKNIRTQDNDDTPLSLSFPARDEKVKGCLVYMNDDIFNEQLSLYGLPLERKRRVEYSHYQLDFSRTGNRPNS